MPIIKHDAHRVAPHGIGFDDADILLARHGAFLIRRMSLHFGGGAFYAELFKRNIPLYRLTSDDLQQDVATLRSLQK